MKNRKNKLKPGKFIENYVHEIQQNVLYFFCDVKPEKIK